MKNRYQTISRFVTIGVCLLGSFSLHAEENELSRETKAEVIRVFTDHLSDVYVFEEKAIQTKELLEKQLRTGVYDSFDDPVRFARALSSDVYSICNDKHLRIGYNPEHYSVLTSEIAEGESAKPRNDDEIAAARKRSYNRAKARNFGYQKVEVLEDNIGYLKITTFQGYEEAFHMAAGAMAILAHTDAIIIDLRNNGGGDGAMTQFLMSYFYPPNTQTWLLTNTNRSYGFSRQEWTQVYVPGKKRPDVPLYVLVNRGTGSAAEGFAFAVQQTGRGLNVGETTWGGGHSGTTYALAGGFTSFIPAGRIHGPNTEESWEAVGVKPDIEAASGEALQVALQHFKETQL